MISNNSDFSLLCEKSELRVQNLDHVCMIFFENHANHENHGFQRLSLPTSYSALKINMNRPDERPEDDIYADLCRVL